MLTVAGLSATCLLGGCAADQGTWVEAMEKVDGVASVEYRFRDNQLVGPDDHEMTVRLEDDLSEGQVRRIAEASCEHEVPLTRLTLTSATAGSDAGAVTVQNATPYDSACLAEQTLAGFAAATAAMSRLLPEYDGDFFAPGFTPGSEATSQDPDRALVVVTTSADRPRLLDALRSLQEQRTSLPLDYVGWWDEDRDPSTQATKPLMARLSPRAGVDALAPLVNRAFELDMESVAVTDLTLTVTPPPSVPPDAAELHQLAQQAAAAGIELIVRPSPGQAEITG